MHESGARSRPRIIVADDLDDSREVCAEILRHYGFEVISAADGLEALELARRLRPDLILLDLAMPVLDGWETARRLRNDTAFRDVPLVALTAYSEARSLQKAREAGFDLVVTKPCEPLELRRIISELLGWSVGASAELMPTGAGFTSESQEPMRKSVAAAEAAAKRPAARRG